ncbi:unnamed protein product [Arabidopsis thaliana]|uniref:(thale cress) hypothetical protein n=1 Tax=Arabidopsis thaliana TaxID=3702 RepID=A0A7G2DPW7_ARATH|nr:unnamed protein product [Arabidopsis thaliana]
MKMNINKACDLKSISVFPPNLRRRSAEPQASQQLRSQQSQQSFSQGPSSSQRGCGGFSQMTQSSVDELLINDQRFSSQERDLSLKKVSSCLPPINHKREDSQLVASRSSSSLTRRWSSASIGESKFQISEELEQRFGMMETSLSRFGMMLDSIQSDIMQANRGTKEVFLETERIQQKLTLQDTSLQQLRKEQADSKASLDGGVKSILEEFSKDPNQEKLQKILQMLTTIPEQVETALQKIQREICHTFTREIQVLASLRTPEPRVQVPTAPQVKAKENLPEQRGQAAKVLTSLKMPEPRVQVPAAPQAKENFPEQRGPVAKSNSFCNTTLKTKQPQLPRNPNDASARAVKPYLSPKIQVGCWKTVKPEKSNFKKRATRKPVKSESTRTQFEQCSVVIDSDEEDIDVGFSCLINENTRGTNFEWDAEKETERILRTARRTKRKFDSRLMGAKNLHLFLYEIIRKLKHAIRKEKPDKRLLGKKKSFEKSLSTKDHFFLERMTSISQKRFHQEHNNPNLATSKQVQRNQERIVWLPEYSSPFSSPGRIWKQNSTVLLRSSSYDFIKSETIADDSITLKEIGTASSSEGSSSPLLSKNNQIVDEMSKVAAYGAENEGEFLEETLSLPSVGSPSHYISKTEEYDFVLEPLFISPARGEAKIQPLCNQLQEKNRDKESVFKYVKAVLEAIDSNWEELYLKTEISDQLLYPALISNIPFYPNQLCVEHELLFDCINEVLFEFCRFPQWVSFAETRTQVLPYSVESIVPEVQEKVYCHLLPMQLRRSLEERVREDMAKHRSWLDIRCDLECIGFETSELILNELLEQLMLELEDNHKNG